MDWSRFVGATFDALVVSFTLGAVLSPPDPFTQILYTVPAFFLTLPAIYLYGRQSISPWWRRYLVFAGGVVVFGLAWQVLTFAVGPASTSGVRFAVLLAGTLFGAWLAYFGGLDRIRGESA
jgi:hypothetical protein